MDTILVFGGGFNRVKAGLELAQKIPGSKIIVSANKRSQVMVKAKELGIQSNRITCVYGGY